MNNPFENCRDPETAVLHTSGFQARHLDEQHTIFTGQLPAELVPRPDEFEQLWDTHPPDFHVIRIHGRSVATPRWQQAFGRDYHYTGKLNAALSIPAVLEPFVAWSCRMIDARLNGILVNWYDGERGHYIGKHRDSTANMIDGMPIVTISLGEERVFRMRRSQKTSGFVDVPMRNGTVIVLPYSTNRAWTHEVPNSRRLSGRRISVTLRGFVK